MSNIVAIIALIYVLIGFYTDIRWMIIPNKLVLSATGVGITVQVYVNHWSGFKTSIIGFIVAFIFTFGLYIVRGVGAGDVKGLAALGAITGAQFTVSVLLIALIYTGVVGLLIIIIRGKIGGMINHWWISFVCYYTLREKEHIRLLATHRVHSFPFMVAVMPAFITCLVTI